jgi:tripartite ATP-independent transporter DctM subunit
MQAELQAPIAPTLMTQSSNRWLRLVGWCDGLLGTLVEWTAATLVAAEIVVLLVGVIFRYALHQPLTWTDELASLLFMWLAMLGSVMAFRRNEHMRMTAVVAASSPRVQRILECLALVTPIILLMGLARPAFEYAIEEGDITTPAMEISNAWRAMALPVGIVLMLEVCLGKVLQTRSWRMSALVAASVLLAAALLTLLGPWLTHLGNFNLLIYFVGLVGAAVLLGVPIGVAFGLGVLAYLTRGTTVPLSVAVGRMDEGMSHVVLLAVPLFIYLGGLLGITGIAKAMISFLASLVGHLRGGLSYVLLLAMYLVSGISGSKAADMAAVAPALFPEMKKRGSKPGELVALLAAAGAMSETIPPSLVLITVGSVTGVSIAALFTGGLIPAVVLMIALGVVVAWRCRDDNLAHVVRANRGRIVRSLSFALPGLLLPFVIRAAVVEGMATATEVSTLGVVYCILVGSLFYRQFNVKAAVKLLGDAASLSGAILFIIGTATAMAWSLTQSGFSQQLAAWIKVLPGGAGTFMAISIAIFIVLGSVLEGIPAIVLFGPLLFPIARAVGIHEVHYAMVVVIAMGIGLFAPPFGVGYYAACAIGRVNPDEGMRPIWGYLAVLVAALALIALLPWFSTGLL